MTEYDRCVKRCVRRNFDARASALFQLAVREFPQLEQTEVDALLTPYSTKAGKDLKEVMAELCECQCSTKEGAPKLKISCPPQKSPATALAKKLSTKSVQQILKGREAMAILEEEISPVRVAAGKKAAVTRKARMKLGEGREIWITIRPSERFKKGTIRRQDIGAIGGAYRIAGILKTGGWQTHQFALQKYNPKGEERYKVVGGKPVPQTPRAIREYESITKRLVGLEQVDGDYFKAKEKKVLERDKPTPAQKAALKKARKTWMEMDPKERARRMPGGNPGNPGNPSKTEEWYEEKEKEGYSRFDDWFDTQRGHIVFNPLKGDPDFPKSIFGKYKVTNIDSARAAWGVPEFGPDRDEIYLGSPDDWVRKPTEKEVEEKKFEEIKEFGIFDISEHLDGLGLETEINYVGEKSVLIPLGKRKTLEVSTGLGFVEGEYEKEYFVHEGYPPKRGKGFVSFGHWTDLESLKGIYNKYAPKSYRISGGGNPGKTQTKPKEEPEELILSAILSQRSGRYPIKPDDLDIWLRKLKANEWNPLPVSFILEGETHTGLASWSRPQGFSFMPRTAFPVKLNRALEWKSTHKGDVPIKMEFIK